MRAVPEHGPAEAGGWAHLRKVQGPLLLSTVLVMFEKRHRCDRGKDMKR